MKMKNWQMLWRLIRFRPWLFFGSVFFATLMQLSMQAPALLTREFFNYLTDGSQARFDLWALVALMVGAGLAEATVRYGLIFNRVTFHFTVLALMRKNVFAYVLSQPGARPMPTSPGESISRFGGDLDEIGEFFRWVEMLVGHFISSLVASPQWTSTGGMAGLKGLFSELSWCETMVNFAPAGANI